MLIAVYVGVWIIYVRYTYDVADVGIYDFWTLLLIKIL